MSNTRCVIAATLLVAAGTAHGTVLVQLTERELALSADRIVVGRCTATETLWLDKVLVTAATVEVSDTLKGEPAEAVTVLLPGGVDFDRPVPVQMTFPGAPRVTAGEELFLFLSSAEQLARGAVERPHWVAGYSAGKLEIDRDASGERAVQRNPHIVRFGRRGEELGDAASVPLASYAATIRAFLAEDSEREGRQK